MDYVERKESETIVKIKDKETRMELENIWHRQGAQENYKYNPRAEIRVSKNAKHTTDNPMFFA